MVQTIRIEASSRERAGKGAARAARREGKVPAVIYGAKLEATLIALDPRDIMKELHKGGWQSHLYEVSVPGGLIHRVLMRDIQFHPVTDRPLHVDFQRLSPGSRIRVQIPVVFLNEDICPGIKTGGVLNVVRREVEVMAFADAVPERFEVDLADAALGDSLRWSSVKDQAKAKPVVDRDFVVATVAPPTTLAPEEEVGATPGTPAPPASTKQKSGAATNVATPKAGSPAKGDKSAAGGKKK